ncbi:TBC1 domain family member 30 isoform X3 [Pseudoliparis swirei]|uniref:TBC1 domain family member 30 isoform X3 n=1 Tax=Pseudoliparis swirei TaxID=2059687 RepID=UPI0024BEFFBE|nr:TBC1 domain family member 30 isoform X3 [Pseudoliparis swirei]
MASELKLNGSELLVVDICDGSAFSEEESGVFVNSAAFPRDDFSGFHQWSSPAELPNDTSSPTAGRQVLTAAHRTSAAGDSDSESRGDGVRTLRSSIVDCLLVELYETYGGGGRRNVDSWDSSTEASGSDAFPGRSNSGSGFLQELQEKHTRRHQMNYLAPKAPEELQSIVQEVRHRTGLQSTKLLRQLRRRDRLGHKLQKNYDVITACLQAVSQKRRVDTRLKFTIEPLLGKNGFQQWYDALKAVARLPTGIPKEWRKRVWLTLADQYLHSISIDWEKTLRFAFNERSNPDDDSLGIQIVKDLHRTGCSSYSGQEGEQDRVVLKRVLLAYARWNKSVGYCQGFNVLAALILEVTEGHESDALKVMIYLIDKVLPESYFANNLQALSVDMAVFRDLLRLKLPRLSQHLHQLQKAANKEARGLAPPLLPGSYEPPLTNVFTMQWFLTMFATCLPAATVLKIWDSVFFEGSEVLFRVAIAIWERLGERIEYCHTADEFYSTMGCLSREMLEHSLVDPPELMQEVYCMAVFPFPQLAELREKYTYNITPFPTAVKPSGSPSGVAGSWESDEDADMDDEDSVVTALGCLGPLGGLLAPELQRYHRHIKDQRGEQGNIGELSPGAVGGGGGVRGGGGGGARAEHQAAINSMMMERMSTDIYALKKQYTRIKRRQQQQAMQLYIRTDKCPATRILPSQLNPSSSVINHLLLGRRPRAEPPPGGANPTSTSTATLPGSRPAPLPPGQEAGSPWRSHVRVHRKNIARARAELGFGDSGEREGDEEEEGGGMRRYEGEEERKIEEEQEEGSDSFKSPSPDWSVGEEAPPVETTDVSEVEVQLDSLDLEEENPESKPAARVPLLPPPLPPPASSDGHKESDSSGSERSSASDRHFPSIASPPPHRSSSSPTSVSPGPAPSPSPTLVSPGPAPSPSPTLVSPGPSCSSSPSAGGFSPLASSSFYKTSSPSTPSLSSACSSSRLSSSPSTPVFSPFPSVKQPRRSAAARNLGLYGPTARTPSVHFPQISRSLNRSSATGSPT